MTIPMNEAGMRAFEVISDIAWRMYGRAVASVEDFVVSYMPGWKIVGAEHIHSHYDSDGEFVCGKYCATVRKGNGTSKVVYDYQTRGVSVE